MPLLQDLMSNATFHFWFLSSIVVTLTDVIILNGFLNQLLTQNSTENIILVGVT